MATQGAVAAVASAVAAAAKTALIQAVEADPAKAEAAPAKKQDVTVGKEDSGLAKAEAEPVKREEKQVKAEADPTKEEEKQVKASQCEQTKRSEVECCRDLKKLLDSGRVQLNDWHPGASFDDEKKVWMIGPISRSSPNDNGHRPPWVYMGVSSAALYFQVIRSDDKEAFEALQTIVSELCAYSHQRESPVFARTTEKKTLKPEFQKAKELEDFKWAKNTARIEELISELVSLGVDAYSLERDAVGQTHPEWYNVESISDYSQRFDICSRTGLALWDMLSADGLIEKATPNWYRTGSF